MVKFTTFLKEKENVDEATVRVTRHLTSQEKMKQKKYRKSSTYKVKMKMLARLRARKKCPNGQVVDYNGKGCHKPKHQVGIKKRY